MKTRNPALDGLRAVACLAVVGHHAGVPWLRDGWLGVDVFFVLSGWLITGLLLEEIEKHGRVRLGAFYLRRAARLYPALIVLVAAVLLIGAGPTSPGQIAIVLTYFADIARSFGVGVGWLGHTWSLAIEEHFYLLWPLALTAAWKRGGRRWVSWTAGIGVAMSLAALMVIDPPSFPMGDLGYNSPLTRGWELLAGCLLAATTAGVRLPRWSRLTGGVLMPAAMTVTLVLLGGAFGLARSVTPIVAVAATCWLLLAVQSGGRSTSWLTIRPLPWLGMISYGIYLFHPLPQWLLMGWGHRMPAPGVWLWAPVMTGASIGLAAASWALVEAPIQRAVRRRLAAGTVVDVVQLPGGDAGPDVDQPDEALDLDEGVRVHW